MSEAQRRAAAVHRRVAHADDQYLLADRLDVLERHRLEPGDADVNVGATFNAARKLELLALRRAGADEHGVEAALREQFLQRLDGMVELQVHAHLDDLRDLVVEHFGWQTERGDVGAHEATGHAPLLEDRDGVAQRHQIVRDRERGAAGADQRDLLAVLELRDLR